MVCSSYETQNGTIWYIILSGYNLLKANCKINSNGFKPFPTIILLPSNFCNSAIPLALVYSFKWEFSLTHSIKQGGWGRGFSPKPPSKNCIPLEINSCLIVLANNVDEIFIKIIIEIIYT